MWLHKKHTYQITQVECTAKRLTQNDLKKEEAGQVLEHKDNYFLASVEFLKQSRGRKIIINIKHSPILTHYFFLLVIDTYLQHHQIFCFKICLLLI